MSRSNEQHPITVALAAHQLEESFRLRACQLVGVGAADSRAASLASTANANRSFVSAQRLVNQSASSGQLERAGLQATQAASQSFRHNGQLASSLQISIDPRVTAQAMVGAARASLVILMGVLVTKLILSSKKNQKTSKQKTHINSPFDVQEAEKQTNSSPLSSQYQFEFECHNFPSQLPPGPRGLPFLGYLPFLGSELHMTLTQLSNRYGPIYQIFLGSIRVVVLTDASLVRQAFRQPVFSGRPDTQLTRVLQGYGIVNSDGALWREQRAFLHSALRKLGLKSLMNGSNGLEAKIQNQVREFVNDLSRQADSRKSCELRPFVARSVSSVVGSIVMNSIYRMDGENKFDRLNELMEEGFKLFAIAMPLDFIPILRFLPSVSWAYRKLKQNRHETSAFFNEFADQHRRYLSETYNLRFNNQSTSGELHPSHPKQQQHHRQSDAIQIKQHDSEAAASITSPATTTSTNSTDPKDVDRLDNIVARDLVDAYIIQQKRHEAHGKQSYFSDKQLIQIMSDIFSAGLETVTSTIDWSILFMILNPDCQKRVQAEIDSVIGQERLPELNDLTKMPYTEATIFEVLRRSNVVPLGNAHATLEDASIGDYFIPKGTQVLPNLYGMNMNEKLWTEPEKFEPARFLTGNEGRAQKPDHFIPFSVGRRVCLGDLLAKMEVFLFLSGLLQKFDLSVAPEDGGRLPKIEGTIGISNAPVPFKVGLRRRVQHQT